MTKARSPHPSSQDVPLRVAGKGHGNDIAQDPSPAARARRRLGRIREARGFSQGQLGLAIGAWQRMIAYYESHAEKAPARHLTALAKVLRVSVDELVGYRPVATPAGRANPRLWHRLRQVEAVPPQDRKQARRNDELDSRRSVGRLL